MEKRSWPASELNIQSTDDLYQRDFVVVGLGQSGQAAAHLLLDHGARVLATDANPDLAATAALRELQARGADIRLGPGEAAHFKGAQAIILSPGVPHRQPNLVTARRQGIPVLGELELAARLTRTPMVAVTGTNGKTTTTELITAMLSACGQRVLACGNIGRPLSQCLDAAAKAQWLVVEVSSFQLDTMETFHPRVAVLLNIAQDHMDRYPDFDAYCASKARILANQDGEDTAVAYGADPRVAACCRNALAALKIFGHGDEPNLSSAPLAARIASGQIEFRTGGTLNLDNAALAGRHNRENIAAAALATLAAGGNLAGIGNALDQFQAPRHRMETLGEIKGVTFVNDSKATNPNAVHKALVSFERPVVLILGGRDKDMDFSSLQAPIRERVKTLVLMGEARGKLKAALDGLVPTRSVVTLEAAVQAAWQASRPGDVVLLSPACASFDQYANYQARGEDFGRVVATIGCVRNNGWSRGNAL